MELNWIHLQDNQLEFNSFNVINLQENQLQWNWIELMFKPINFNGIEWNWIILQDNQL